MYVFVRNNLLFIHENLNSSVKAIGKEKKYVVEPFITHGSSLIAHVHMQTYLQRLLLL